MPSRSRLSLVISLRRVPLFYQRQIPRRRLPPTSHWMAQLDGFWQSSKTILSFVRMRTSCGFKMSLQERKTESPSRGSATTMFFRSTTLTSDNFRIAFGQTWRVSKETKPTLLQARVLVKFQKWIFLELSQILHTNSPALSLLTKWHIAANSALVYATGLRSLAICSSPVATTFTRIARPENGGPVLDQIATARN